MDSLTSLCGRPGCWYALLGRSGCVAGEKSGVGGVLLSFYGVDFSCLKSLLFLVVLHSCLLLLLHHTRATGEKTSEACTHR